jgi:heat shock protein HslJ
MRVALHWILLLVGAGVLLAPLLFNPMAHSMSRKPDQEAASMQDGKPEGGAAATAEALSETGWRLTAVEGHAAEIGGWATAGIVMTIDTHDEGWLVLGGHAGCNSYFGSMTISDESLEVGMIGLTRMACLQPGIMEREHSFVSMMQNATQAWLTGDQRLILRGEGDWRLIFVRDESVRRGGGRQGSQGLRLRQR